MKKIKAVIFSLGLMTTSLVHADTGSMKKAEELLNTMNLEVSLQEAMSKMVDLQVQSKPELQPYKSVLINFLAKYMSYESLKPDLVKIYAEEFTASELEQINAFYKTSVGQKAIRLMPELMAKGGQLGQARVQEHLEELRVMIEEEAKKIQQQKNQ